MNMYYRHHSSINFSFFPFFFSIIRAQVVILLLDELFIQNIPLEIKLQCKLFKIYMYKNIALTMRQGIIFAE